MRYSSALLLAGCAGIAADVARLVNEANDMVLGVLPFDDEFEYLTTSWEGDANAIFGRHDPAASKPPPARDLSVSHGARCPFNVSIFVYKAREQAIPTRNRSRFECSPRRCRGNSRTR